MIPQKIFLIGLPGSGKTTIGKELAAYLKIQFVDLDSEIEKREGRAIKEIFKEKKEDYFRKIEQQELKRWCTSNESFVMATGGGAPCFFDNMEVINASGKSIFLDVPAREIAERIAKTKVEERPLLSGSGIDGLKDKIELMRSARIHYYKKAHFTFKGAAISLEQVVKLLG